MPGTIINENYVQGIPAGGPGWPTYGLHNDEGTAYIKELDNVLEISPNVTYTINCEDYGQKHDLTIKRTYATVNKMGKNPPTSDIDTPIVVSDNVWPFAQYKICLNSGIGDDYRKMMPTWLKSAADYAFPASCATTCSSKLPIRKVDGTVWIAPDGTTSFTAGADMTKARGTAGTIKTPSKEGEYRIYVLDASGKVLSKSGHLLRLKGTGSTEAEGVIEAESCDYKSGIETETCSEGGTDVGYIEDGDYIGFKNIDLTGADKADFRVASNGSGGNIEVRLDSADGKLIGKAEVGSTGGWQDWTTKTCTIEPTSGKHDVYLVFTGGESYLFNINWWKPNTPAGEYILGDLNGDGKVNGQDLIRLRKFLNGEQVAVTEGADVNGNGTVNGQDIIRLRKHLNGENVVLGPKN
jgi:hypothetical protein